MIHEVDESLRRFLRHEAVGDDVDVAFDAPTREWARVGADTRAGAIVDLFLCDVREVPRRVEGDAGDAAARSTGGVLWYRLTYVVTAWGARPEDEHRLLSVVLRAFARHDRLPREALTPALARLLAPLPYRCARPGVDGPAAELWSAIGGDLKPSLELVLHAPLDLDADVSLELPPGAAVGRQATANPTDRRFRVPRFTSSRPERAPEAHEPAVPARFPTPRRPSGARAAASEPPPPPLTPRRSSADRDGRSRGPATDLAPDGPGAAAPPDPADAAADRSSPSDGAVAAPAGASSRPTSSSPDSSTGPADVALPASSGDGSATDGPPNGSTPEPLAPGPASSPAG